MIDLLKIENLGIEKVIHRGSAEIIEQDEDGIFVYDTISKVYMISCLDLQKGKTWVTTHEDRNYGTIAITGKPLADYIAEKYLYENKLECYQVAYLSNEIPTIESGITSRTAELSDLTFICDNYSLLSEEEIIGIIEMGNLIIAGLEGKSVGFVGEHLEGSIGLLYVLPEYRRQGIASALENIIIKAMKENGYIPFGQVEVENDKSYNLQQKLGFTVGDEKVYWLF